MLWRPPGARTRAWDHAQEILTQPEVTPWERRYAVGVVVASWIFAVDAAELRHMIGCLTGLDPDDTALARGLIKGWEVVTGEPWRYEPGHEGGGTTP